MSCIRKIAISIVFLNLFVPIASAQQSIADYMSLIEGVQQSSDSEYADLSITQLLTELNVPGASVAIIKDFEVRWAKGYGVADVVNGALVNTETLFQAASISKPVNAMAVLKTAEQGLISMDQDINSILVSWQIPPSEFTNNSYVTPRMLASHVSGLGDGFGFPGYDPGEPLPSLSQIFDGDSPSNVGPVRMARPPMTAFHYSGGGVTVLQQALLDTYNKPYSELLKEVVLDPIGMTQSTFQQPLPPERDRNAARAHVSARVASGAKWHVYPEMAAAGLWTTPTDLAKFAIEVQQSYLGRSNKVLSQQSVSQMLSPVGVGPFAVGFSLQKRGEGWYFDHGGSNFGFQAQLTAHKTNGYGFAIMTNSNQGGRVIVELARRIEQAYEFDSLKAPVRR